MKLFLYRGLYIIQKLYTGINLILQILAVLLTYIIVVSGFDWDYFLSVRNQTLNAFFFPALLVGFLVPVIFPLTLLAFGYFRNHKETKEEGVLLSYAAFFGWFISSLYKAFTGRVQPDLFNTSVDSSKNFNFGFFEHGIFWGWPSSHTAVAFATMTALFLAIPRKRRLRWIAILYACYIGIGVSLSIHWFSEFVAGTLIGIAVGRAVEETLGKKTPEVLYLGHMKNSIIAIGIVLLLAGGAYVYVTKHRLSTTGTTTSTASSTPVIPIAKPNTTSIHITKVDKVPANASSQLTYKGTGTDSIAFEVKGSIKNVKLVKVALDGPQLSIKDTIKEFGSISNNTLYITTTIPQEVPAEMLTWQSDKGLNYSWIIGTNGTTGSVDRTYNAIE